MNKKLIAKALQVGTRKSGNSKINTVENRRWSRKSWIGPSVILAALAIYTPSWSFADETNLLVNGDFEDRTGGCTFWLSVPEGSGFITGWNVNIPSVDDANGGCNNLPYYSHSVDLLMHPDYVCTGNQAIDMAGSFGSAGDSIYQDVPTTPGQTYTLTFYTSSNGNPKENGLTVEWDDVPIATISTPALKQWSTNTFTVQASSELSRLRFVNNIDGMQGSLLDGVSLVLVDDSDKQPPVVSCPPSITVASDSVPPAATNVADFTAQGGSIADNQDPNPSVISWDQLSGSCPVLVTRTYTVTDAAGNATQCQQLITLQNHLGGILWFPPLARFDKPKPTKPTATFEYVFKYGRTIPVKIRALGCDGENLCRNTNIIGVLEVLALSDCQDASTAYSVAIDGASDILMERSDGHFKYDLKTKKLPADTQCYLLKATITDTASGESVSESLPIRSR
jgi:Protein of unknown function (DUF642)